MSDSDDLHALTGAYALDALSDDERHRFEAHLETCEACSHEVEALRSVTERLDDASETAPPRGLRERILVAASTTPQAGHADPEHREPAPVVELDDRRRRAPRWSERLTAAAAVLVIAVAGLSYVVVDLNAELAEVERAGDQAQATAERLGDVLAAPDAQLATAETGDGATARVVASEARGGAVFVAEGLADVPSGRTYQLWLIDESGPESAGLFTPSADGRVMQLLTGNVSDSVVVGVTVEPDGGSPEPTTDPVLAIEIG
ncbi:MAG: anti-sigma factor [Nitriliruptoraceae bacterium]